MTNPETAEHEARYQALVKVTKRTVAQRDFAASRVGYLTAQLRATRESLQILAAACRGVAEDVRALKNVPAPELDDAIDRVSAILVETTDYSERGM